MKRFSVFLIIIVVAVAFGFMTYYFLKDNEKLTLGQAFYEKNKDEEWSIEAEFYKHKDSTTVTVTSSDTNVVEIGELAITPVEDSKSNSILSIPCIPKAGGYATITIETSNENIEKYVVDVSVGDGSKDYPYFIDSVSTLGLIGTSEKYSLESSYKLSTDLNLADYTQGEWAPIGGETGFSGTFDGNFHTLYNLKITNATQNAGFFTKLTSTAVVQNLTISGVNISGTFTNVGAIAGVNHGKVKLCSVVSNISGIGGLVSTTAGAESVSAVGGIVGRNEKQSAESPAATVNQVYTNVNVSGNYYVGGLIGSNTGSYVYNCYTNGTVSKTGEPGAIGGLIGYNDLYENKASYIKDCYTVSAVDATVGSRGVLIGFNNSTDSGDKTNVIFGCYYSTDVNTGLVGVGNEEDPGVEEDFIIIGKSTADLKIKETFISHRSNKDANTLIVWDFNYAWLIETDALPTLNLTGVEGSAGFDSININGSNVNTAAGLQNLAEKTNDNFLINNDIDMNGAVWTPIEVYNGILAGVVGDYDENGNTRFPKISNLTINVGNNGIYALFETLGANAQVMNLIFENITIQGTGSHFAVIAGTNKGTISNVKLGKVGAFVTINATTHTSADNTYAGVVAAYNEGMITDCTVNATVIAQTRSENINFTGGIAGFNTSSGTVTQCVMNFGEIDMQGDQVGYVGGIVGSTGGVVSYSYSDGCEIKSSSTYSAGGGYKAGHFSGGITGYVREGGRVESCYSKANISGYCSGGVAGLAYGTITQCYAAGMVTGHRAGGLVAMHLGGSQIKNSYAVCELVGYKNASGYDGGDYSHSSLKAGLACISEGSSSNLTQCYTACTYSGAGKNFFDTSTIVPDNKGAGNVRKNVIDATLASNAEYAGHQGFWGGLASSPVLSWMWDYDQYFRAVSTETMKGNTSDGFKVYTNYDFGDSSWSFTTGYYPELKVFSTHSFFTGISDDVVEAPAE